MRLIIAGSRSFDNYEMLKNILDKHLKGEKPEIVSGGAKGADSLGERYARERGLQIKMFPADWEKDGRKAGPIRNEKMCLYADSIIAYWDMKSAGTGNVLKLAKKYKLNILEVINVA